MFETSKKKKKKKKIIGIPHIVDNIGILKKKKKKKKMKIIGFPHIVDNIGILRKKELQFMIISEKLGKKNLAAKYWKKF